jgi:hypothetical protein
MAALASKGVISMAFRLPANLELGQHYQAEGSSSISALEESLPHGSRMLVGLTFTERYDGFEADCERANERLLQQEGLYPWPEYPQQFVTPDPDGEPVAWVHYQSSPAWFVPILVILGGIFLLPVFTTIGFWITEQIIPGIGPIITLTVLVGVGVLIYNLVKEFTPVAKEVVPAVVERKLLK